MRKSLKHLLTKEAQIKRRREWAEDVVDRWLRPRAGTTEDVKHKGMNRDVLLQLADIAILADDIRISEINANNGTLPGPDSWLPGPQMWKVIQAMYCEFGYVIHFLAYVRECSAPGFGFVGKGIKKFGGSGKGGGRAKMTPTVVFRYMRNPAFMGELIRRASGRYSVGYKDIISLIEELAPFRASEYLAIELSRSRK
jgi:hypothetical protein